MKPIIDLTYAIYEGGSKYPTDPAPHIVITSAKVSSDDTLKSGYAELTIRTHHGTHIDAPAHKLPKGKTIDEYPPEKFINRALLIDLTPYSTDSALTYVQKISQELLKRLFTAKLLRQIRSRRISALILRTGYDQIIERGATDDVNFPYFEKAAAAFLIEVWEKSKIKLNLIGVDSFSVDRKGTPDSPVHCLFFKRDILILETLVHLDRLKKVFWNKPFKLICLPIPYKGADAAQARALSLPLT